MKIFAKDTFFTTMLDDWELEYANTVPAPLERSVWGFPSSYVVKEGLTLIFVRDWQRLTALLRVLIVSVKVQGSCK